VPDDIARGMREISDAKTLGEALTAIRTNLRAVLETTLQSLGASAPALVGAAGGSVVGPGGTAVGAGLGSFAVEYGSTLQDVMAEKGVNGADPAAVHAALNDPELMASAREKALKRGVPVAMFDALTAGLAGRLLAGAKPTVGSVAARAAGELGLQAGGGAAGEAGAQLATGEYKPGDILMEAIAELPTALIEAPGNYRHAMENAQRAQKATEFLDRVNKLAAADKLLARDPQTFEQFVAQAAEAGPVSHVFIDAQTLMQSGVAEQVVAASPAVAQQLPTALQTGGQIAIPIEEYTAKIAPTEYAQSLLDHLKTDPEGFSRAEAQQFMQSHAEELRAEVERVLAEKRADDTFKASAEAVRVAVKNQLDAAARFTPQVNDAYAALVSNFYAVTAAKLNTTPEELFQRYPLRIQAESAAPSQPVAVYDQGEAQPTAGVDERTGLPLNSDGTVTLYHHTTAANAEAIKRTGVLRSAGEPDVYLTTHPTPDISYGDTVVRVRIDPSKLELDDEFPGGREDFRVHVGRPGGALRDATFFQESEEFRAVERAYGGREAYEKAKAEGRTKLNYRQWVQVRTPSFKKWFGDWEALHAQQRLDATEPIQVRVPEEWRDLSVDALRQRVAEVLDEMVRSKVVIEHPELGEIRVGRTGQKKTISEGRDPAKLLVAADLEHALPASILARVESSQTNPQNSFAKLLSRVDVDGIDLVAVLTVRRQADGNWYYNTVALEEERPGGTNRAPGSRQEQPPITGLTEFSRGTLKRVNPDTVSKVVDPDTGEPLVVYHGTKADFTQFVPSRGGEYGSGIYLTPDEGAAWMAAERVQGDGAPHIMPVYVALKNPYTATDRDTVRSMGVKKLKENGYDGIIATGPTGERQYVAFDPEQIKSAIGNRGTFDPNSPDILFQSDTTRSGFTPTERVMAEWRKALGRVSRDRLDYAPRFATPGVLRALGAADKALSFPARYIMAVRAKHPDIPHTVFERLPLLLSDPLYVLPARDGGFDVVLDAVSEKGSPLVVGVREGRIRTIVPIDPTDRLSSAQRLAEWWRKASERPNAKFYARNKEAPAVAGASTGGSSGAHSLALFTPPSGRNLLTRQHLVKRFGGNFYQGARGAFDPQTLTITLLKAADLSTFLHESGHFFLEVQFDLASRLRQDARIFGESSLKPGERQLLADTDALLRWFGVRDLAEWHNLDFEEKRAYHEKFARGFEAYLFEGKAPSIELQGLFQRFRAWLLNVYRSLKALNVELNDEVRGVFDRMLATNEQIALAEQGRSMMPLFASPDQAGMTPEEFAAYQALGVDATNEAIQDLQARGLRDMRWLHNARGRVIKQLQKEAKAKRAEVRMDVRREVMSQPIYRAWQFLTGKLTDDAQVVNPQALNAGRLDLGELKAMRLPEEVVNALKARRMTAANGLHPDIVAELFGFTSGDELVRKLAEAAPPDEAIEALTDARMLEQHGELSSPEAIEKAADRAIHNEVRARFVATEANALAKATGKPKVLASAAKAFASAMIARLKVRDIRPGQYANAEARAAKAAEKASKEGKLAAAAAEKRNQLINLYATRAAYDALDEVERGLRYLRRFDGDIQGLDADYADQIHALLERFDLRKGQSNKAVDKRAALAEWIKAQREAGFEPDIPPELENEAFRTHYKNLTIEEFRGLVDTIKQIEHLGRLKHKLLTAADQRAYEAVRDEIAASIRENAQGRQANTRTPTTNLGRALQEIKRFWASHIKAATWARILDGGKDGGPMWEYFIRTANERADMETTMRAEATAKLSEILAPVFKLGKMGGKGQFFPTIGLSLNREARLAIALNMGNEGNIQRLLDGEGWTLQQVMPVLQSLTAAEWQAVQQIWDHFESYRPKIAAKERRVYGKEPTWVEPRPFTLTTADGQTVQMRGGYYPIKYDPAASQRAEEHAAAESARRQLQGAYTTATTRRSFTKTRAEEVTGRPLLYTLAGLYSGVNDVIHDLAWHEWLIDANRLLRSQTIDKAIREHYGPEVKQQFKTWVKDIAEGEKGAANAGEAALGWLRQGVSAAGLGFNVMSAAIQITGFTQSIVRVGARWVGRGVAKYLSDPIGLTRQVNELSDFMAARARTRFRELNELRNQVQDRSRFKEVIGRYSYFLMMRVQQIVDVPTWWGAYEKAITEGHDEARAVAMADQAVIDAQGSGQVKDLSAIERGGPVLRLFTVFYTFMNTALNLGVAQTMTANTPAKRAKLAVDYLMLYTAPAVLGYAIRAALTPGDSGDDDLEKLAKKLAAEQLSYLMGLMVIVREFDEAARIVTGEPVFGYRGPAGLRAVADTVRVLQQAAQGEFDDAFRKAAVDLVGDFTGLPGAQINRTITGAQALAEGKTDNPAAVVFGFQEKR
jgi:hypothetical protein